MSNKYLLKLWLFTLTLAPFLHGLINMYKEIPGQIFTLLEFFPVTILFSVLFSIPTLLIILIANKLMSKLNMKDWVLKIIILIVSTAGIISTLKLIGGSLIPTLMITYCLTLIISSILIEIFTKNLNNKNINKIELSKNEN